ncbi:hypothetical protein [Gelatiniphilus marinus]|uniref:Uncharacterized protein n=1 Tax=Gelatiniphilus marinus TaxID=1759464 RepID=A0ABW5JRT2_9FLAO
MTTSIFKTSGKIFDILKKAYENKLGNKIISSSLVALFIVTSILSFLVQKGYIYLGSSNVYFQNPFFAIEVAFIALLTFELFSLIFVLPKSVSRSVGKQLELLSLIFIRGAFKEFSHIKNFTLNYDLVWRDLPEPVINMIFYAMGSLAIFTLLGFTNKLRKHKPLTHIEADTNSFILAKKLLALVLIVAFTIIIISDVSTLFATGYYLPSFHTFYTMIIFSDILIVLIALRYTMDYYKIFRYSSFVVATIFIRLALSVKPYYDVLIGVFATVFVFLITLTYNYFLKDEPPSTNVEN